MLVKLVDQENLMELFGDDHEEPNIDICHIKFVGHRIVLPPGVSLSCA